MLLTVIESKVKMASAGQNAGVVQLRITSS
jgi:hypothetical protein